ncbi:MAG: fused MFS/spermidine synthase [Chloroflexi bacterium]|jgi:predicted membrane-bound spermidine synthase|nr:fused MFS/spermidine synthase [Chloroflexota bacterium]MBT3670843.1 fused MFS/spermidine synthase [Chloroflexota bacterium]MBT4002948.1 fused MFS/spermidine synthase [Chloroflexota bacterium]MBT4305302.1 fused MFS/spermidine synthase [Chloroflexota bacterium]MBT4532448.1 fused MFS/spermidine synthase [Chloroflexota bacterium]
MNRKLLYFSVFSSGMVTLAVELSASRLLGNVFGTSNLVWASIIGLILIYLTVGYFVGGKWADRSPNPLTFFRIMLWGAFTAGIVPLISKPVLRGAADAFDHLEMGILLGAFAAVLVLFIVPITLLGTMSPFAIRLAITTPEEAGEISGKIYAISTLGSFIGTFLPVLIIIPMVGTANTFILFSLYLMAVALVGLGFSISWKQAAKYSWMPILLILLAWGASATNLKNSAGQIYETESAYNYIQVQEFDGYTYLRLNDGQGVHSIYHPDDYLFRGPWMQFLAGPFFNAPPFGVGDVERIAIVGLAGGTTAYQATQVFGPIPIDGYEIDPKIIEVGKEYFGLDQENINAVAQDGRWGLAHSEHQYSLIAVDAYRPPYIPWHLTTKEFFEITYAKLAKDGVLVINVGRAPEDRGLIDALVTTLSTIYPSIHVMDIPRTFNSMVYASKQITSMDNLSNNLNQLIINPDTDPLLIESILRVIDYQKGLPEPTIVFTDDHAPVEWIINKMVLGYLLSGQYEELQK